MSTLGRSRGATSVLLVVASSSGTAWSRRTRRRRCRRSCRPAGCRARAAAPRTTSSRQSGAARRAGRRRSRAAWPGAAASGSSTAASRDLARRPRRSARSGRGTTGRSPVASCSLLDAWRRPRIARCTCSSRPSVRAAHLASRSVSTSPGRLAGPSGTRRRRCSSERSAFCSASVKLRPIAIASPTLLHRRGQRRVGGRELLEREPRHLDHDVVQRRLEAAGVFAVMSLGISSRV